MPRQAASVKATGGGGYTFADKVAAGFLAQMLKRKFPLEPELGPIAELHFETRESGHVLDDLLLVLKAADQATRCMVSVKSNRQLTKRGFNEEFVQDAWEEWSGSGEKGFVPTEDVIGLVVGVIDEPTLVEWQELQKQASSTTPERLAARLANDGQSSPTQRQIFETLLNTKNGNAHDPVETARLISRIRVLRFSDDREGDHINLCTEIVGRETAEEGSKLWSRLLQLASENRGTGGFLDLPSLIRILRPEFELRDYPDFERDWKKVEAISAENIKGVHAVIASGIRLPRQSETARLTEEIDGHNVVVIAGESGSGKSAAVSQLVGSGGPFRRVLWLTAGQLSKASQAELANSFGLNHSIPELLANSAIRGSVMVVDGFERFEGEARRRTIELLRGVGELGCVGWKIVITCQPQSLDSAHDLLIEAGIAGIHQVDFEKPGLEEVLEAVESVPAMRPLLLRAELQPILRNLMVLDWVLRANVAQRLASTPWVGVTDLIDRIWERWTGDSSRSLARDALLRTLGKREGEMLSGAVHVDAIPPGDLELLGEFAREGVVRIEGPSIQFAHDLMGDWARYRVLKFAGTEAPVMIRSLAHVPRWGRAIRLYAQSLVEHGKGLGDWKTTAVAFAAEDAESKLASDLFLDGLLFAANSEDLIEQAWPDLVANGGQILHRLLKRLVHVASFPDWRFKGLVDPKLAEQSEAWFRIPQPLFWIPVLRVLVRHAADVASAALIHGAEACALWLRTMPFGVPGRREAALLAVELAKEAQARIAEGVHFGGKDKLIYEALLSAALELPDEVEQIALELCGRRDEPAHALRRGEEEEERQAKIREEWEKKNPERKKPTYSPVFGIGSYRDGPMRPPAPDGPLRAVGSGFQASVLDTAALTGLISVRAEIAREVLLAVCIEEPKPTDPYESRRGLRLDLGLADWQHGYPAAYWKGPFLQFLKLAPKEGLDAIVRLVNYATSRWIEAGLLHAPTDDERKEYGFEFEINGKSVSWVGGANVFAWHRQMPMEGDVIESALMALEKWLYEEIESGRDVTEWLQYVLNESQSAAFAGLLISVGLKYPALFAGILQPLLGNYYIYQCQMSLAQSESGETWRISFSRQPQEIVKLAAEWNRLPHRRQVLWNIATWLMHQDSGTAKFLAARKAEWEKLPDGNEKSRTQKQFFLARFDPANYTKTPQGDGKVLISMSWPLHLQKIVEDSENESKLKALSLSVAPAVRRLLDGQESLSPDRLMDFAAQVQELAGWKDESDGGSHDHYRISSVAGGIAVLVTHHREWLAGNPELEQWCLTTLRTLNPAPSEYSPVSFIDHSAEIFLGEAGVALLRDSNEEWVLRLAFEGVTGGHYNATLFTMWRAYLLRDQLGERFAELVNVVVLWSALRRAAIRESGYHAAIDKLEDYRAPIFRRLMAGKLRGPLIPLRRAEILGRRLVERIELRSMSRVEKEQKVARREWARQQRNNHKLYREMPDIDHEVLQKGFGFVSAMLHAEAAGDDELLKTYIEELFELLMRTLPRPEPDDEHSEIEGTPYDSDRWIIVRVAEFIARANSVEVARTFYRPILELGPAAKYWVEDFLESWIEQGLLLTRDVQGFASIWRDMVAYVETLPVWQPGDGNYWCRAEGLATRLMGLSQTGIAVLGDAKYKDLVSSMAGTFEHWGSRWLKYGSVAGWFAYFLRTDSGRMLLPQGVKQLAAVAGSLEDRDWQHHDLGALLTDVLSLCWNDLRDKVESDADLRKGFLSLLAVLCARQIPEALHLRSKVRNH